MRHICLEGPEAGVYFRGRLKGKNTIELPPYWEGLIDVDSITVTLTQIGSSQDLIVESIDWGKVVKVKSGNGTSIDCYYVIQAARIDGEPLIVGGWIDSWNGVFRRSHYSNNLLLLRIDWINIFSLKNIIQCFRRLFKISKLLKLFPFIVARTYIITSI